MFRILFSHGLLHIQWIPFSRFLAHLGQRPKWTIYIALCPVPVCPASGFLPPVYLSHFQLLFCNHFTEFHEKLLKGPLSLTMCFSSGWVNKHGCGGFWLANTILTSPQLLHRISWNFTESKNPRSSTKLVVLLVYFHEFHQIVGLFK